MEYALVKVLHLGALVFWLGPPLGAWLMLRRAQQTIKDPQQLYQQYRLFYRLIALEHVALLVLLGSGVWMAANYSWFESPWLQQKLKLVFWGLLPLELLDILLANYLLPRYSKMQAEGAELEGWQVRLIGFYHGPFTYIAIVLIPCLTLAIMYLASSKQLVF